ncbi:MAG: glycosyltransferase family 2 protein [Anaerovibrio sp.]|uniref:glycosyltransferase family 2 protein n=1 Tax=Anaerovibrio sp. TaxID=1872532 RepID=UPI0025BF0AA2|nr:glycosyltransferase family 2 protein [Anaerovibrio sp.]MBE6099327.1 glycosyltransferase family 2 protein [Anaerovibrio sp.]
MEANLTQEVQPKVSFVIPAYNAEKYLDRCLQSILGQTYQPWEIICVDDGSTDSTGNLLEEYASCDHRFRIIHQKNGGLVYARKVGVAKATGDYVSYVDADDEISLTRCEELLPEMRRGADIIFTDFVQVYGDGYQQKQNSGLTEGFYDRLSIEKKVLLNLIDEKYVFRQLVRNSLCGCLFKTKFIQMCQMKVDNSISIGEGCAAMVTCLLAAQSLSVAHKGAYYYYKNNDSMCHQVNRGAELLCQRQSSMALIKHLQGGARRLPLEFKEKVERQMNILAYNNILLHDYELFGEMGGETIFPYGVPMTAKIVLYGAGSLGVQLYRFISTHGGHIVLWSDRSYKKHRDAGLNVDPPEKIGEVEYDYILMGIGQYELAVGARDELLSAYGKELSSKIKLLNSDVMTSECLAMALEKMKAENDENVIK